MIYRVNVHKAMRLYRGAMCTIVKSSIFKVTVLVFLLQIPLKIMYAQTDVKPLTIGDTLPDVVINDLMNYKGKAARLSDFSGKIIILDFWATYCTSCIEKFPKLDELQAKYPKDLQVILVNSKKTKDTKEKIEKAFQKRESQMGYKVTLPYTVADSILDKYVPFRYVPHIVWLDGHRKILAITSGSELTEENLVSMLKHKTDERIRFKSDDLTFDPRQPLFTAANGNPGDAIMYRSTVSKYVEGLGAYEARTEFNKNGVSRYYSINSSLSSLYTTAFKTGSYAPSCIVYETSKADMFRNLRVKGEEFKNYYCYELIKQVTSIEELKKAMQKELINFFGVTVIKEKRVREACVLTYLNIPKKDQMPAITVANENGPNMMLKMNQLIPILTRVYGLPIVDETKQTIQDLFLPTYYDRLSQEELTAILAKQGIQLAKASRIVDVLVFKDI